MSKIIMTSVPEANVPTPVLHQFVVFFNADDNDEFSLKDATGTVSRFLDVIDDSLITSSSKTYSIDKIKSSIQELKNDLLDGAGAAYDTLKELQDAIVDNDGDITALLNGLANRVAYDYDQTGSLTSGEQLIARNNIDSYGKGDIGNIAGTDFVAHFEASL